MSAGKAEALLPTAAIALETGGSKQEWDWFVAVCCLPASPSIFISQRSLKYCTAIQLNEQLALVTLTQDS